MIDEVDGVTQGAVFSIPMQMESGTLRAARNPKDGQIYYSGLTGWQAGGPKEGSIQRLRYTGKNGALPARCQGSRGATRTDLQ